MADKPKQQKQKDPNQSKKQTKKAGQTVTVKLSDLPLPDFIQHRLKVYEEIKAKRAQGMLHIKNCEQIQ